MKKPFNFLLILLLCHCDTLLAQKPATAAFSAPVNNSIYGRQAGFKIPQGPYKITWSHCFGGSDQDIGFSFCEFDTSEILVASYTYSHDGTITTPVFGNADWWAMKFTHSDSPQLVWSYTFGGSEYDKCRQITPSYNHKSYALFGTTHSRDGEIDTVQLNGETIRDQWWLVKINDSGRILKQKLVVGGGNENNGYINLNGGRALLPTADNGYILQGWSTADSGDFKGKYPGIHTDTWLFKVDSDLNIQWRQHYGGSGIDAAIRIIRAGDYYYFTGETTSNDFNFEGQNHLNDTGGVTADFGVWKTDTMGNLIWAKSPGGSGIEFPFDIHEDWDGNIVCGGYSTSVDGDVTGNHNGSKDAWLFKLRASDGSLMWEKDFGGSSNDAVKRILPMADHGFTLLCTSASTNDDAWGGNNHGNKDVWLLRIDSSLNIMYATMFGGSDSEEALDIQEFPGKGYMILASTSSDDSDLLGVKSPLSGEDDWMFFVADSSLFPPITGIQQTPPAGLKGAYLNQNTPNPFSKSTTIEYYLPSALSNAEIVITDISGTVVKSMPINGSGKGSVTIYPGELPAGAYFYSLVVNGKKADIKQMVLTR